MFWRELKDRLTDAENAIFGREARVGPSPCLLTPLVGARAPLPRNIRDQVRLGAAPTIWESADEIKALVADFDGLILKTETPDYTSWSEIYRDHEHEPPQDLWREYIGRDARWFDPAGRGPYHRRKPCPDCVENLSGNFAATKTEPGAPPRCRLRRICLACYDPPPDGSAKGDWKGSIAITCAAPRSRLPTSAVRLRLRVIFTTTIELDSATARPSVIAPSTPLPSATNAFVPATVANATCAGTATRIPRARAAAREGRARSRPRTAAERRRCRRGPVSDGGRPHIRA